MGGDRQRDCAYEPTVRAVTVYLRSCLHYFASTMAQCDGQAPYGCLLEPKNNHIATKQLESKTPCLTLSLQVYECIVGAEAGTLALDDANTLGWMMLCFRFLGRFLLRTFARFLTAVYEQRRTRLLFLLLLRYREKGRKQGFPKGLLHASSCLTTIMNGYYG